MEFSGWLLFFYQVPANPSTHRSYVWRKLKALGALYLQNSICLLPRRPALEKSLDDLRSEIETRGGEARLLRMELCEESERNDVLSRFRSQMDDEYGEYLEQCENLHTELGMERQRLHFTFGELEENEADLVKLRSWLPKLLERDYFEVPLRTKAIEALRLCEEDFAVFEGEVEASASGPR